MIKCPFCGGLADAASDNCIHCGGPLKSRAVQPGAGKTAAVLCPACGAGVGPGDIVCVKCGTNLLTGQKIADEKQKEAKPGRFAFRRVLAYGAFALVVLAAAGALIAALPIMIIYLILRKTVVSSSFSVPGDMLARLTHIPSPITYNLNLIFLPHNLHSFSVGYPGSLLTPSVLASFFIVLLMAVLLYAWRKESLVVFSVGAFFLTLLPVLNVIAKASVSLVAMRWLYLPS